MLELKRASKDFRDAARISASVAIVGPILMGNATARIGLIGIRYGANKVAKRAEQLNQACIRAEKKLDNKKLAADAKEIATDLKTRLGNVIPFKKPEPVPAVA